MKHITIIAGARPNFMKIAPIIHAIKKAQEEGKDINFRLVHTGQHYDHKMSNNFFTQLDIPAPDINLEAGGGSQAEQTAAIMTRFEEDLKNNPTDCVLVVGDVTSTMACAIVAQKLGVKVAHVEGGIRSNDWGMPEEINRLVTDAITNYFFTTSGVANENLRNSGVAEERIFFVGNTMIDTLVRNRSSFVKPLLWDRYDLKKGNYIVLTLHRPNNVDDEDQLRGLLNKLIENSKDNKIIFPVHPRTKQIIDKMNFNHDRLCMLEPLGYLEFNYLVENSLAVVTDSGGITEETTFMGIPCITLRENTERPETVSVGTNELIGTNPSNIAPAMEKLYNGQWKKGEVPELWDGKSATRITEILVRL